MHSPNSQSPRYFSWLKVNEIAGCSQPKSSSEMSWLKSQGIKNILCLSRDHMPAFAEIHGLSVQVIHIEEFEGPSESAMGQILNYLRYIRLQNESLVVHCRMGWGRTGVVLAMFLMAFYGQNAQQAIQKVRYQRPHSIETRLQEESLVVFEDYLLRMRREFDKKDQ